MQPNINIERQPIPPGGPGGPPPHHHHRNSRLPWVILAIVVIIAVVVLAVLFRDKLIVGEAEKEVSDYQAVFLTNGQVYFGKLSGVNNRYLTLKDIYYLQVNQPLQSGQEEQLQQQQQPQLSLVKLGNELHGPVDAMKINKDQVLFYEDLKTNGKVVEAIMAYKVNPNQS